MMLRAADERAKAEKDFRAVSDRRVGAWRALRRAEQFPISLFSRKRLPDLRRAFDEAEDELQEIADGYAATELRLDFEFDERTIDTFRRLEDAHGMLAQSAAIWDVTTSLFVDRRVQRTSASSSISRAHVQLTRKGQSIIASRWSALTFGNANGEEIDLFPGICVIASSRRNDFALVDLRELKLELRLVNFIEDEAIPNDAKIIGQTWRKTNLDGPPDKRFKDNYQIPIALYARLDFSTAEGASEAYMFSNVTAAERFVAAFHDLQHELRRLAERDEPAADAVAAPQTQGISAVPTAPPLELPPLPAVRPAHEYTAAAIIFSGALGFLTWQSLADGSLSNWLQAPAGQVDRPAAAGLPTPEPSPSPQPQDARSSSQVAQPSSSASPASGQNVPLTARTERVRTRQGANIRSLPAGDATIVRTAQPDVTFRAFRRSGSWVEVGDTYAFGWIHNSLLAPVTETE
jgi:hypothetical protein